MSGCKDAGAIEKLGGHVLGHIWRIEMANARAEDMRKMR